MPAQIKSAELDLRDRKLLGRWMLRWIVLRQPLILQHVQQRGLSGIVEAEKKDPGVFVGQTCVSRPCNHQSVGSRGWPQVEARAPVQVAGIAGVNNARISGGESCVSAPSALSMDQK